MLSRIDRPRGPRRALACLVACLIALACLTSFALAHEGHDHGEEEKVAASAHPRIAARSALYEIVAVLKDRSWSITLDDAATNAPVVDAKLLVVFGDAAPLEAKPTGAGLYAIPQGDDPLDTMTVTFAVSGKNGDEVLAETLQVAPPDEARDAAHGIPTRMMAAGLAVLGLVCALAALQLRRRRRGSMAVTAAALAACLVLAIGALMPKPKPHVETPQALARSDAPRRFADGAAFAAKATQRLLDVRTVAATSGTARPAAHLIGRVIADPNRSGIVQSITGGRVMAGDNALPRIGQTVAKGDVLVQIDPYLPVADRTTISEKVGEIEQLMAIAETRLKRLRPLAAGGAVPTSQIGDLETELEGLKARRETVLTLRANREVLRAPTSGIITSASVVPGQVIQPQDVLFQIADPQRLWIEAFAYGDDGKVAPLATATAANGEPFALDYLGISRALRQHATIMHFAIPAPPAGLNIGQPVTVLVQSGEPQSGFILPRDSVVTNAGGESIVWVHEAAERFEPRPVRTSPVDATRVLVASGLEGGERVVVRGADLVNQIR